MDNRKIKIALMSYAIDNRSNKGTAVYARKIIENLLEDERLELYLVHFEKVNDPLYKDNQIHEIIMPSLNLPRGNHFFSQLLFFWKYRKNKFDIIHWFQPRVYPFFWLAPAKKIVITAHGAGEFTVGKSGLFSSWLFRNTLKYFNKWVDIVIADSHDARKEIIQYYKVKPKKVKTTYLGGGESFLQIDKKKAQELIIHKYNIKTPFILDVSRLMYHKNVNSLIKAYVMYRKEYKGQAKLVIIGSPTLDYQKTFDLANNSLYKDDIYFINFVEQKDLNAMYSAAELFVFPSLSEGFGLPVVEAMASGTPVITSNTTSLPEVAGEAGILVDPLDIKEIAKAMNKVLTNENFKNDLISHGLDHSQKFTWVQTAKQTKDIYLKLLGI